ncbi:MAG: 2-oxoacid:acceptor oxidoreductase family protein [Candidatus Asgardarchaeia archaeon]
MARVEIRFAGFGGQGISLLGFIVGKAISLYSDKNAVLTRTYGPEERGGASSSCVVVDDGEIDYPYATNPDLLVIMSQESYTKYCKDIKKGGLLFVEKDLVKMDESIKKKAKVYRIPATALAEQLGNKIVANIIMLGAVARISGMLDPEALKKSIADTVKPKYKELNLKAFEVGYEYGEKLLRGEVK